MKQLNLFEVPEFSIDKRIRMIELFAGYGSQSMALERLGVDFEHYKMVEFDKYAVNSFNAVHGTNFPVLDITQIHGKDLEVVDKDNYCYIMTYSFPCQSLSLAGKQEGMAKGSGTRSSLLWEVERILTELKETDSLPQVLLMENVTQVHSDKNAEYFQEWIKSLAYMGYSSFYQDMNSKDYGVPQNRERTFMVSLLGSYDFHFPESISLDKVMKDYLEDEVDEKYFIKSEKAKKLIEQLIISGKIEKLEDE